MHLKRWFIMSTAGLFAFTSMGGMPAAFAAVSESQEPYWHLRQLGEETGAVIAWREEDRTAVWTKGDVKVELPAGSRDIRWNGQTVRLKQPLTIRDDLMVVPASFFKDYLGVDRGEEGEGYLNAVGRSRDFVERFRAGTLQEAPGLLSEELSSLFKASPSKITWSTVEAQFGPLTPVAERAVVEQNDVHVSVHLTYASTATLLDFTVRWKQGGQVDDFQFYIPNAYEGSYKKPGYDDTSKYREREVVIGQDPWRLPGTLTLPAGKGPFPAVILVHGSGPNDRNQSLYALKPFRDLAVGLASQGVAVLRYEKRTREHPLKSLLTPGFTIRQETVEDALLAAEELARHPEIDAKRIFAAGHSLGGMMIPRLSKADTKQLLAGKIVISGPARPLEDIMVEQYKYLSGLGLATEAQVSQMERQRDIVQSEDFDPSHPPADYVMGSPVYWADLSGTYAADDAKDIRGPILIVQGERDYQVTPDHLELWRKALQDRKDVSFLSYPKLNHMLVEGEGQPTPQEYAKAGNVPYSLIQDLANWVLGQ